MSDAGAGSRRRRGRRPRRAGCPALRCRPRRGAPSASRSDAADARVRGGRRGQGGEIQGAGARRDAVRGSAMGLPSCRTRDRVGRLGGWTPSSGWPGLSASTCARAGRAAPTGPDGPRCALPPIRTFTVGPGISPGQPVAGCGRVADCHRRFGIAPTPEHASLQYAAGWPRGRRPARVMVLTAGHGFVGGAASGSVGRGGTGRAAGRHLMLPRGRPG